LPDWGGWYEAARLLVGVPEVEGSRRIHFWRCGAPRGPLDSSDSCERSRDPNEDPRDGVWCWAPSAQVWRR